MKYLLPILLTYLQYYDLSWAIYPPNPYCIQNKTEIVYVKVNKTRQVQVTKPWYKKLSKPDTKLEYYEEEEAVPKITPVRGCCEGYYMDNLNLCQAICIGGCPQYARCVEPQICKCRAGYAISVSQHDKKQYCAPLCDVLHMCPEHSICVKPNECACRSGYRISESKECVPHCTSGCPFNGTCVAPNVCQCPEGYKSEKGSCLPICSLGDQCKNGECVDVEKCKCNFGFSYNEMTHTCQLNLAIFEGSESYESTSKMADEVTEITSDFDIAPEVIDSNEDVDLSQVFDESSYESTTTWDSVSTDSTVQGYPKCPDDFVLYRGRCEPLRFGIDEIDCRLQPCPDVHSLCLENGTCTCQEGYRWYKKPVPVEVGAPKPQVQHKSVCLSLKEYTSMMQRQQETAATAKNDVVEEPSNFMSIFFIVLGVLVMTCALVYVGLRLVRTERGQLDVENKHMSCVYDNRACSEPEKSTI